MSKQNPIKIVICGLDNAGKTSIVKLLANEFGGEITELPSITPTIRIERSGKGWWETKNLVVWDFGGQEMYHNEYLNNPHKYFQNVSGFFYIVDVQDKYKLPSSVMYFKGLFQLIQKHSQNFTKKILRQTP